MTNNARIIYAVPSLKKNVGWAVQFRGRESNIQYAYTVSLTSQTLTHEGLACETNAVSIVAIIVSLLCILYVSLYCCRGGIAERRNSGTTWGTGRIHCLRWQVKCQYATTAYNRDCA